MNTQTDSNTTGKTSKRPKNPLYVVTEKGKTVQVADGAWDALVKKLGLAPVFQIFKEILDFILKNIVAHAGVDKVLGQVQNFLGQFDTLLRQLFPFAYYYR